MNPGAGFHASLCDYHVHTSLSFDAAGSVDECCRSAVVLGLREIGFCEHAGIDPTDEAYGALDYGRYRDEVRAARLRFAGRLEIKMGVEIDFRPGMEGRTEEYLEKHAFDFVTGAVHYVRGEMLLRSAPFEKRPWRDVWGEYFAAVLAMVRTGLFDVIAHLDVPKRGHVPLLGRFDWREFEPQLRAILAQAVERGAVVELNTSGLRKQAGEIFPSPGILELYRRLGGDCLTFGSDAHHPARVGWDFAAAVRAAAAAGLRRLAVFTSRRRTLIPISAGLKG